MSIMNKNRLPLINKNLKTFFSRTEYTKISKIKSSEYTHAFTYILNYNLVTHKYCIKSH